MYGGSMIVKLERHANHIIAFAMQETGDNGRIHAARHRHNDAGILWTPWEIETVHFFHVPLAGGFFAMKAI
jgi:hypothetical protein